MKKFWYVCHEFGNQLSKRLGSFDEAKAEAERLASARNQSFVVLEAVGLASPMKPPVQWTDAETVPPADALFDAVRHMCGSDRPAD